MNLENDKKYINLYDSSFRLEVIHKLRWIIFNHFGGVLDDNESKDVYIEANEMLNELENKVWKEINNY